MTDSRQQTRSPIRLRAPWHLRAFSLYDMLVTLTVVGTVSAFAIPSFQQLVASQRMSGAINTLVSALHLARSEAIRRGVRAALCPSADGHACHNGGAGSTAWEDGYLLYIDLNGNHEFDADETAVWLFGATEGLNIRSTAHRDHVTYQQNGMASGTNLTFTLCDKRGRGTPRAVIVSNSGRARTSTRAADGGVIVCPTAS